MGSFHGYDQSDMLTSTGHLWCQLVDLTPGDLSDYFDPWQINYGKIYGVMDDPWHFGNGFYLFQPRCCMIWKLIWYHLVLGPCFFCLFPSFLLNPRFQQGPPHVFMSSTSTAAEDLRLEHERVQRKYIAMTKALIESVDVDGFRGPFDFTSL